MPAFEWKTQRVDLSILTGSAAGIEWKSETLSTPMRIVTFGLKSRQITSKSSCPSRTKIHRLTQGC